MSDDIDNPDQERLDELDQLIRQEEKQWEIAGINRGMLSADTYFLDLKVQTLIRIVEEHLDITENQINIIFKEVALKKMQADRKMIVRALQQQQIAVPAPRGIIGPNGKPLL